MSEPKPSVEIIAPSIEEAIAQGVEELGIPREELKIEILDEGVRGFLGLGSRQARVRLTIREGYPDEADRIEDEMPSEEPVQERIEIPEEHEDLDQEALETSQATLSELIDKMGIQADISAHWGEKDEKSRIRPLHLDVTGSDLSILIGRRGETLNALQYITRLIVGKELRRPVPIVIDIEGYRARRERQLGQLARRMAQQAVERGRSMALEPMPPNERRIIHIALRDHPKVYTESVGEGNRRKVTIFLRSDQE